MENQAVLMFNVGFMQMNDVLAKLYKQKSNSVTLLYESHVVYLENFHNIILSVFAVSDANIGLIYEVAADLRQIYPKLNDEVEKIR